MRWLTSVGISAKGQNGKRGGNLPCSVCLQNTGPLSAIEFPSSNKLGAVAMPFSTKNFHSKARCISIDRRLIHIKYIQRFEHLGSTGWISLCQTYRRRRLPTVVQRSGYVGRRLIHTHQRPLGSESRYPRVGGVTNGARFRRGREICLRHTVDSLLLT